MKQDCAIRMWALQCVIEHMDDEYSWNDVFKTADRMVRFVLGGEAVVTDGPDGFTFTMSPPNEDLN